MSLVLKPPHSNKWWLIVNLSSPIGNWKHLLTEPRLLVCIPLLNCFSALWGLQWEGRQVCFHSDNEVVVAVVQRQYAKDKLLHSLLRCLFFYAVVFNFHFSATHIPGAFNWVADAISRNHLSLVCVHYTTTNCWKGIMTLVCHHFHASTMFYMVATGLWAHLFVQNASPNHCYTANLVSVLVPKRP